METSLKNLTPKYNEFQAKILLPSTIRKLLVALKQKIGLRLIKNLRRHAI